jgi:hypothetical protein
MEDWWCAQNPGSLACKRSSDHNTGEHTNSPLVDPAFFFWEETKIKASPEGQDIKDLLAYPEGRQDIRDMHDSWCKEKPEHIACKAWTDNKALHEGL